MDEHGQTWTDMDNGKIKYFDADCADPQISQIYADKNGLSEKTEEI